MTKYKVGDEVRIVASTYRPNAETRKKIGTVGIVVEPDTDGSYELKFDTEAAHWWFAEEDLTQGDPMDNLKQGDVLVRGSFLDRTVQGLIGDIVFYVYGGNEPYYDTVARLKDEGWTLKDSTDTVEITIEEIAKLKGLKPEQVRIKDKD